MRIIYLVLLFVCCGISIFAQPLNDECGSAFHLPNTTNWCSEPEAYTNINATPFSGSIPPSTCFIGLNNEVWFTFRPETPAMYIKVSGAINGLGTLRNPSIAIFDGSCNNLNKIGCNSISSITDQVELSLADLVIGRVYYLLVEGQGLSAGTFQICLNGFIPPPNPQSDCYKGVLLCDKSPFVIDTILGIGIRDTGVTGTCIMQELSSAWYKWTCEVSGTLTFTLTPNNYQPGFKSDDIDFVVYELPGGLNDCANKREVRCMAAGANGSPGSEDPFPTWRRCNGPTGLQVGSTDTEEDAGCREPDDDSWIAPLDMIAGKSYALLVNNFSQSGLGFTIEWGGTGTFQGPKPAFDVTAVQAFECDKTIIFDNQSLAPTDSIVSYVWSFGAGATPISDTTTGPISVIYESFGDKKVALTVTSSKGCVVTEILDFFIEPCCADTSTLSVTGIVHDQLCPNTSSGAIQGVGISGAPLYQFSLDCVNYQPSTVFPSLFPGSYTLCIQDEKGCESQVDLTVLPASGFNVELGDSIFIQLGQTTDLHAFTLPGLPTNVVWNNINTLTFPGSDINSLLNPTALPHHSGWYSLTIANDLGCVTTDSVFIFVDAYKPIYIPNVFSPNNDSANDWLTIYGNSAATSVKRFQIFDRWGGLMWEGTDFLLNEPSLGWDGTCNNQPVSQGVYAYRAEVDFLDDIPLLFTGTVTVLR
ncbi:MAG TPA: gliding motility-associated C-terminal domain-containing protein [Saprospiraceae bacterium]|nr:gliding motility-associated C-terminal domain-containing protein [Saprospiraceae bacterium]